VRMRRGTGR